MNQVNCTNCNSSLSTTDKFCPRCGSSREMPAKTRVICPNCKHKNLPSVSYCEKCGNALKQNGDKSLSTSTVKKIVSKGSYSGVMTKSNSKFWYRWLYAILTFLLVVTIAFLIWFKLDPEAGEKLRTIGGGIVVMAIFILWIVKGKKGGRRGGRGYDEDNWHDDDHGSDDGGDD